MNDGRFMGRHHSAPGTERLLVTRGTVLTGQRWVASRAVSGIQEPWIIIAENSLFGLCTDGLIEGADCDMDLGLSRLGDVQLDDIALLLARTHSRVPTTSCRGMRPWTRPPSVTSEPGRLAR